MADLNEISIPSVEDAYKFLGLVRNLDGCLTRLNIFPEVPAVPWVDPDDSTAVALSRDITLNSANKTFIRLFRPRKSPPEAKLPLILYFHGGGFVLQSAATGIFHDSCNCMAAQFPALIASVEYRLEPEHRLPAAYDDAVEAICWVRNQALAAGGGCDPWVKELVDFSRVFLMGSSAGGNIVYHAALRAVDLDLEPLRILGLIMNQPFLGGVRRTETEIQHARDPFIPLNVTDLLWSLALPEGADRGHWYCDPSAAGSHVEKIRRLPESVVRVYAGDILVEWQKAFAEMLEARGVRVVRQFVDSGHHGVEVVDPKFAQDLYDEVGAFVRYIGGC